MTDVLSPPHNLDAEQGVLGSMLLDRDAITRVVDLTRPEDFYRDAHRRIYETIVALFERGEPVDLITVTDRLRDKGQLDDVGGASYITSLLESVPTAANVEYYSRIVRRDSLQRQKLTLAQNIISGDGQQAASDLVRVLEELHSGVVSSPVVLTAASEVRIEPVSWVWRGRIPARAVTAVVGLPGEGKSTWMFEIAARASRGQLDGDLREPIAVVIATAEDSATTTVVPRLMAAGADLGRIYFVETRQPGEKVGRSVLIPDDLPAIRRKMEEVGARFLIIDPLVAHLPGSINSWRDQDIRRALAPLARLADDLRAAVVIIVHLNKREIADVVTRISGSVGIAGAVRSILLAAPDPSDPDNTRLLAQAKSSLAPFAPALRYRIDGRSIDGPEGKIETSGIVWLGEATDVRANELLERSDRGERTERIEAGAWLREILADGPRPAKEVFREARQAGISETTLQRAKRDVGVRSERVGGIGEAGSWCWALPDKDGQPGPKGGLYPVGDHLRENTGPMRASDAGSDKDGHLPDIDRLSDDGGEHVPPATDFDRLVEKAKELFNVGIVYDGPPLSRSTDKGSDAP